MKAEKIVLLFVALIAGLGAAGAAFYFYQSTKTIPESDIKTVNVKSPSPTQSAGMFLNIDNPADEEIVDNKTVTLSGKTIQDAVIVISTPLEDDVIKPASNGNFTTSITLDDGPNFIEVIAIAPNGEEIKKTKIVTYSTEDF